MNRPTQFRSLAGWLCLLAVALLFAPYAGAAWMSHSMNCCTGDHCDIPQHHHRKAPVHADCDHDSGMPECAISCCQDEERPLLTAMNFVMPPVVVTAVTVPAMPMLEALPSLEIARSILPLLQPPRT